MCFFFFFKQKTAYEMRISDWSSDVCSSDLVEPVDAGQFGKASPGAIAHQHGDEVDGLGDQGARDGDDSFLDQLLHPPERTDGASGVDRPNPARVAGAPSLEEIKRLGAAHFANRNPVRAKAKAGTDQIG